MKNSIYRITLDMHDVASQVQITAKQHDTARKLHITLTENGKPYSIEEGCRAVLSINRPGSTVINDDCEIKMNGSVIMYDFNSPTTEVLGINECEVKLYDPDGDIITSPRFTLLVDENVYNDGEDHGIDHRNILNRDKEDQHPIKSITGLENELKSKASVEKVDAEIDVERKRIDNMLLNGRGVLEIQTGVIDISNTNPIEFSVENGGTCTLIVYYSKMTQPGNQHHFSVTHNSTEIDSGYIADGVHTVDKNYEFEVAEGDTITIVSESPNYLDISATMYVSGASIGSTEVEDIRVGENGTIYPCAGDAVRGQIAEVKDEITDTARETTDIFESRISDIEKYFSGENLVTVDLSANQFVNGLGVITPGGDCFVTDYIPLTVGYRIIVTGYQYIDYTNQYFGFYDAEKNPIGVWDMLSQYKDGVACDIPSDAAYLVATVKPDQINTLAIRKENGTLHEKFDSTLIQIDKLREDLQTTTDIAKNGVASAYAAYVMAEEAINRTVELTQAEYDALPDSKLTDNVSYFITDGEDAVSSFVLGGAS